ncbi:hypothetical protein ILYODFUR_026335 [Ilyodon furcidens]|uniref:Glycine N-acyltransferase N-terminal domain-containing protein n=1 Tax=Ilyodon furcidens TaxID=33524 RepID=A0ABV0TB86_9TELE
MELTEDQLKVAEIELQRYLPQSLKIYGFLVLRNRVKSDPYIVLVDRWPKFSVIICKPLYEQKTDLFKDTMVFANDEAILMETIRKASVIDWSRDQSSPHGDSQSRCIRKECSQRQTGSLSHDDTG